MRKQRNEKVKADFAEGSSSPCSGPGIKLGPSFIAEYEEALLVAGYVKQYRGGKAHKPGRVRQRYDRQADHAQHSKINPLGQDGKPLTCRCRESYRHFVVDCPHNKEVMDEHVWEAYARDENILL